MRNLDKFNVDNLPGFNGGEATFAQLPKKEELFTLVGEDKSLESERIATAPYSYFKSVFKVFFKNPGAIIGIVVLVLIVVGAIIIPFFTPEGFLAVNMHRVHLKPDAVHLLGCDIEGKDLFYGIWTGIRKSLSLAVISAGINLVVGTIAGLIWGFFRKLDVFFIVLYNLISNIPGLLIYMLLALVLRATFPTMQDETRLIISLTFTGWVGLSQFVRNQTLIILNREYNLASHTLGTPARRIMTKNLLPYLLAVIVTQGSLMIPGIISSEVGLSFFGLGLTPTKISLGSLIENGRKNFTLYFHEFIWPSLALGLIILAFFLIGFALSDSLDPRRHR